MAQYTDANLDEICLTVYAKGRVEQLWNISSPVYGSITRASNYSLGGDQFVYGVNVEGDQQFGFISEDGGLPTPDVEDVKQASLKPMVFVGQIQFTGLAKAISNRDEHAFVSAIQYAADQKQKSMIAYREACLFRTGTGRQSLVNGAVSNSVNVTVDNGNVMWFRESMKIDVIDTVGALESPIGGATVSEVDFENQRIKISVADTYTDNAAIYPHVLGQTTYAGTVQETNGLDYYIKTSGTTNGLALATYPTMKSHVIACASADITEDLLLTAENRTMIVGGVEPSAVQGSKICWHPNQRRKYFRLVQAQKQYTGLNLDAGYRTLTWNGKEAMESYNCPETSVYGGDWSQFERFVAPGGEMQLDTTFGPVVEWQQGYDAGVMYFRCYDNYAIRNPRRMFRLDSLGNVSTQ